MTWTTTGYEVKHSTSPIVGKEDVLEWNQTYGGAKHEWDTALLQTADGGFALAGSTVSFGAGGSNMWLVKSYTDGNLLWNQTYGGPKDEWDCRAPPDS